MFALFFLVFQSLFSTSAAKRKEREREFSDRDLAILANYAEIPAVKEFIRKAQEACNEELLDRFRKAQLDVLEANANRKGRASRPVLEGSPTTWGWKVDDAAQLAAIQQGLEDAIGSSVFEPKQPRTGPLPLTGHMMKDMFYDYHEKHPQLRNLPPSRRSTDALIWTIESSSHGANWKITLSSSLAASMANQTAASSENTLVDISGASEKDPTAQAADPISPAGSLPSVLVQLAEKPHTEQYLPNRASRPRSMVPISSSPSSTLSRRSTVPVPRPSHRATNSMDRASRIPRVASRASLGGSSASTSEATTPAMSRASSPALLRQVRSNSPSRLAKTSTVASSSAVLPALKLKTTKVISQRTTRPKISLVQAPSTSNRSTSSKVPEQQQPQSRSSSKPCSRPASRSSLRPPGTDRVMASDVPTPLPSSQMRLAHPTLRSMRSTTNLSAGRGQSTFDKRVMGPPPPPVTGGRGSDSSRS